MEKQIKTEGTPKKKGKTEYRESDMILLFKLKRIAAYKTPLMEDWFDVQPPVLFPLGR